MAQHDYNIADQAGLSFLQDLNEALEAIVTINSGTTEPVMTYAGMLWLDTSGDPPVIKQRNQNNNGWNTLSSLIDAEVMPSPTAGGYVKRKADNTGNETKTAQQVADELSPLLNLPPASDSAAGVIEIATQTEMEAASSTTVAVTPGRQHYHPSAAKGWAKFNLNGAINASYNVSSITDDAVGKATVNWNTDFSSGHYAVVATAHSESARYCTVRPTGQLAGSVEIWCWNGITDALADPDFYSVHAFGDQ